MSVLDRVTDKVTSLLPVRRERRNAQHDLPPVGAEVLALRDNLDRWLQRFFDEPWGLPGAGQFQVSPSTTVNETDHEFIVTVDVPGMDKGDIDVSIHGNSLVIRGERHEEREDGGRDARVTERRYQKFARTLPFPEDADLQRADARVERGVLTLRVPKREPRAEGRRIPIAT